MPALIPDSATGLYWSIRGTIRCAQHAREIESAQWESEGWAPIPESEEPRQRHYQCQRCTPDWGPLGVPDR